MYDLTKGNYRVLRALSYPEFPESLIVLDVHVQAVTKSKWVTNISINGTYTGPTDIVLCKDYQIKWMIDGKKLFESGEAILELESGKSLRQVWSSIITPKAWTGKSARTFAKFPAGGELVNASISPFKIEGNKMSYEWKGTVQRHERQSE